MFQDPEVVKGIAKLQAASAKMTDEEKAEEVDDVRKRLGMLPRKKKKPEVPYEVEMTEEADMTEQEAAPAPEDTIEIGDDNDNDEWVHGQDEDDDNTLHPWTSRKQGCENDSEEESLFSNGSDNDHYENNPDDDYYQSTNDENKKNKSKRLTDTTSQS